MNEGSGNPATNRLPEGILLGQIEEAVRHSGYPLQSLVASQMRSKLEVEKKTAAWLVEEEWSYIDRDSGDLRALDIRVQLPLYEVINDSAQPRVRPTLVLLVECKRSETPFVFFKTVGPKWSYGFPLICGLAKERVTITTDDPSILEAPASSCLGISRSPYVAGAPVYCRTLSKANRKGGGLELSGGEIYNSVVLPMVKAMSHFTRTSTPPPTALYFDCCATVGLCVIEAPMLVVEMTRGVSEFTFAPFVRLIRQEANEPGIDKHFDETRYYAIDFVHSDYLSHYLDDWVLPFSGGFGRMVLKHQIVLAKCRGFVPDLYNRNWMDLEPYLQPETVTAKVERSAVIGERILRLPLDGLAVVLRRLTGKRLSR